MKNIDGFPPIKGSDSNSFAGFTIKNRLVFILEKIVEDNEFDKEIKSRLDKLKVSISHGKIELLIQQGEDRSLWNDWLKPYQGATWFEVPFYFAEAYFYRLIIDIVDYRYNKKDPFLRQKQKDIQNNENQFVQILDSVLNAQHQESLIGKLLLASLWGNKSDLSQLVLNRNGSNGLKSDFTLVDDSNDVAKLLIKKVKRIDVILDNSGVELFTDLLLAVQLISNQLVNKVVLHAKPFPTFVSDATFEDIEYLVSKLKVHNDTKVRAFATEFDSLVESNKIQIETDEFWNSPLHFYQLPDELVKEFERSDLLIFKGDANYRRVFGDRNIPIDTQANQLASYFPTKALAIRILKSEIMIGYNNDQAKELSKRDENWKSNGKYGIIQKLNW